MELLREAAVESLWILTFEKSAPNPVSILERNAVGNEDPPPRDDMMPLSVWESTAMPPLPLDRRDTMGRGIVCRGLCPSPSLTEKADLMTWSAIRSASCS